MLRQEPMFVLLRAFTEEESFQMFLFNQNSLNYKLFLAAVFVIFLIVSLTLEYSEACQFEVNDDRWSCFMKVLLFPGNVCLGLGNKWLVKTSDNLNFLNNAGGEALHCVSQQFIKQTLFPKGRSWFGRARHINLKSFVIWYSDPSNWKILAFICWIQLYPEERFCC